MKWTQSYWPPVLTGVTPDGWLEFEPGPTQVNVFEDEQGNRRFEVIRHEVREGS